MESTDKRITGKIIKLSADGWGFISSKELKFTRIFFHWTALTKASPRFDALITGMQVSFIPVEYVDKGWRAIKVDVLNSKLANEVKAKNESI